MDELINTLMENFKNNWRNYRFVRISFPIALVVAGILAFSLFVYLITVNPLYLVGFIVTVAAACFAVAIYKAIDGEIRGDE